MGVLHTAHGDVDTPFVGVLGTPGGGNGILPTELAALGTRVLVASTYQLLVRPGTDIVRDYGGLHRWLSWDGPLVADSGRVLPQQQAGQSRTSTARLLRVDDDGLTFTSHIDGSRVRLTPESGIATHEALGADIALALDPPATDHDARRAAQWARRALAARTREDQALYAVVEVSDSDDDVLTRAQGLAALPFDGVALRGSLNAVLGTVPERWPRYLLGDAGPLALFDGVAQGADQLECLSASRLARVGQLYTADGILDITTAAPDTDGAPIEAGCGCYACTTGFARRYVRHLFAANELLGPTLASMHNLWFIQTLMASIRDATRADALSDLRTSFVSRYGSA